MVNSLLAEMVLSLSSRLANCCNAVKAVERSKAALWKRNSRVREGCSSLCERLGQCYSSDKLRHIAATLSLLINIAASCCAGRKRSSRETWGILQAGVLCHTKAKMGELAV